MKNRNPKATIRQELDALDNGVTVKMPFANRNEYQRIYQAINRHDCDFHLVTKKGVAFVTRGKIVPVFSMRNGQRILLNEQWLSGNEILDSIAYGETIRIPAMDAKRQGWKLHKANQRHTEKNFWIWKHGLTFFIKRETARQFGKRIARENPSPFFDA